MNTLSRCKEEDEDMDLDLDAIRDELELQEFHLGLFAEH